MPTPRIPRTLLYRHFPLLLNRCPKNWCTTSQCSHFQSTDNHVVVLQKFLTCCFLIGIYELKPIVAACVMPNFHLKLCCNIGEIDFNYNLNYYRIITFYKCWVGSRNLPSSEWMSHKVFTLNSNTHHYKTQLLLRIQSLPKPYKCPRIMLAID